MSFSTFSAWLSSRYLAATERWPTSQYLRLTARFSCLLDPALDRTTEWAFHQNAACLSWQQTATTTTQIWKNGRTQSFHLNHSLWGKFYWQFRREVLGTWNMYKENWFFSPPKALVSWHGWFEQRRINEKTYQSNLQWKCGCCTCLWVYMSVHACVPAHQWWQRRIRIYKYLLSLL